MKSSLHNKRVKEGAAKAHYHLNLNLDELNGRYHPYDTTCPSRDSYRNPLWPFDFPLGFLLESIPQAPACLPAFYLVGAVPELRPKPPCVRGFGPFAGGLTQHIRKECCYDKF